METLVSGRIREGFLCLQRNGLDEARGDWVSGGDQHSLRAVSSFPSERTGVELQGLFILPK